jgi:hypothetical protein
MEDTMGFQPMEPFEGLTFLAVRYNKAL